jgi:predicted lipid-binding transport protein (Tim44 family)
MKRLGRHAAWLGWVVAGVLALSAGGVAFAANNDRASNDQAPLRDLVFTQAQANQGNQPNQGNNQQGNGGGAFGGLRRGLAAGKLGGGQLLHSETTVDTKDGVKTFVLARGQVTALSGSSITITSSDKVATTFAINGDTRYGFQNFKQPEAQLRNGQTALAIGTKSGGTTTANRIITQGS